MAQELIQNVYEEYKRYCEKNNKDISKNLKIRKTENVTCKKY